MLEDTMKHAPVKFQIHLFHLNDGQEWHNGEWLTELHRNQGIGGSDQGKCGTITHPQQCGADRDSTGPAPPNPTALGPCIQGRG